MSDTLAAALAAVQADLPQIVKAETADTGKYQYTYATLGAISAQLLPLLAKQGLAFTCLPTLTDTGQFVLAYRLLHTSGDTLEGQYPLPPGGGPQAQGSAITYARRYVLCAMVGVAPEDDDGQAAQQAATAVDLTLFDNQVLKAKSVGVDKPDAEWDKLRTWAATSAEHASKATAKVKDAITQAAA